MCVCIHKYRHTYVAIRRCTWILNLHNCMRLKMPKWLLLLLLLHCERNCNCSYQNQNQNPNQDPDPGTLTKRDSFGLPQSWCPCPESRVSEQCGGSCAFDCLIKAVGLGALDMLDALLCNGRRMRLAAATALATPSRALPLLFIESAWTADDKNKTFKCA